MSDTQDFGKWRSRLWPIHAYELKKIVPMLLMCFFTLFNYTVLRDTKDTLIMNACGAAAVPFIKVWGTVPAAILFMVIYAKMSNVLSKEKLFYYSLLPFLVFFAAFAVIIYPNAEALEPTTLGNWLQGALPNKLAVIGEIVKNWSFALFYVLSEIWGSVVLSLLFWGFANQITSVNEAKRVYPIYPLFGNFALLVSGPLIYYFSKMSVTGGNDHASYGVSLYYLMGMVVAAGLAIMWLYRFMNKNVLTDPKFMPQEGQLKKKKSKPKMGLLESFAYLAKSRYLLCLAILVISYGVAINLIEVTWKHQLALQYPNKTDYSAFMGIFSTVTGAVSIFMMLFVGGNMMRRFGWTITALFTPVMIGFTGFAFFAFIFMKESASAAGLVAFLGSSPLFLAVLFGAMQNILSKTSKYAMFDPTKEMAYIPLDDDQKVKGKAAIDVAGARFGKSGGSLIQQVLIGSIGFAAMTPYVAAIVGFILFGWIVSAKALGKMFGTLTQQRETEAEATTADQEAAPAAG